ncbi:TPA: hypothetical protein DEB29_03200 [Candidatus Wolfebacteria bacterium]|nr:hypothetical protein [Candidatus Wolfebacteria bacterium]
MLKRYTIGWKILSGLTLLLLLVIGANYMIFTTQRNRIIGETSDILAIVNNTSKMTLLEAIKQMSQRAADFSSDGFIRDTTKEIVMSGDAKKITALNEHLEKNKRSIDPSIYGINILDKTAVVIASTKQTEIGKNESEDVYLTQSEDLNYGSTYLSDFEIIRHFDTEEISLAISAPLIDKVTGEHIGTLINFIRADYIAGVLKTLNKTVTQDSPKYSTLTTFIIDGKGFSLQRSGALTKHPESSDVVAQCGKARQYTNSDGVLVIGAMVCLDNGWKIVTEIDRAQAFASIEQMRANTLALIIILVAFILVLMYVLMRTVIEPLRMLSDSALKLGRGMFGIRTSVDSRDELGDLGASFNEMAKNLEGSHMILEKKIQEVTEDLEKFKLAVEGASDHIIITDKEGIILYANKAAEEITGYSIDEMKGNRPSLWGKQMPAEFYRRMWRTIKEDRQSFHGEVTNKRKNGQLYIAESHISPIFDEKQNLYGFVGVERDITRQKEIDKSKTEFVSIASHQLRTPLTIINWYVEMLTTSNTELSEKQRQYLDEIMRASKRMIDLVNALLNVSRIDMGTFMVDVQPLDFASVMNETLKDLAPQITSKKLQITKNYGEQLPQINADPKLLRMVFQNLLTNAVKYTQESGVIVIALNEHDGDILISIKDTGLGIPIDQQSKIFTKFFRADNARAKEPDGNGLGLYIIKSLIEYSSGKVWFESEENKGTTFYVSLPLTGMKAKQGTRPLAV